MYKRILVAVDGSDMAQKALGEAIRLAGQWQAQLRIVHVIDPFLMHRDSTYLDTDLLLQELREAGKKLLANTRATAEQHGLAVETQLLELDKPTLPVADMLVNEAAGWPADLIVVGSHGRRGVQRLFLGSVAEGVARGASVPVLLVRGE